MKILHITASYKPAVIYGGPIVSVAALCEKLVDAQVATAVFTTTANGQEDLRVRPGKSVDVDGVPVTYFRRLTGDHTHFSPSLLLNLWKTAKDYDLIHIHAWWNTVSVLSCWLALVRGRKVLLSPRGTLSGYTFSNRNGFYKELIHWAIGRRLLEKCFFHITSENELQQVLAFTMRERITLAPNLVKFQSPVLAENKPSSVFRLLFFSRIEEKKGLDLLITALNKLNFPCSLTIAGTGNEAYVARLKELSRSLGNTAVTWTGQVSERDKYPCLQSHDLLVLPSYNENFANVVPESLSVGTPVIVTKEVGLSDYIASSGFGWVADLQTASLSDWIRIAYIDRQKRTYIRETAPGQVRIDFDENKIAGRYMELYKSIVDE